MSNGLRFDQKEILERLNNLETGSKNKISMIVFAGDLDKQIAAFNIATGAAASGMEVVMFFTFWGISAMRDLNKKGEGKDFLSKVFSWMLPKGAGKLRLSQMNFMGLGPLLIRYLMKKKNVPSLGELIKLAESLGVKICICQMSMNLLGFQKEEMIDYQNLKYCGVATFVAEAKESQVQLFIS